MDTQLTLLVIFISSVLAILSAFIWVAVRLGPKGRGRGPRGGNGTDLFTDEFRTKLQERGVARFEHTLDQNAAFLQQDLRKISDSVSEHIKEEATQILKDEFTDQKQSVAAAQQHMAEAFAKVDRAIVDYQKEMTQKLDQELLAEKQRRLARFEKNMADVVIHHVEQTLGAHMEVGEQIQYILHNLEANKTAIVEDIKREF